MDIRIYNYKFSPLQNYSYNVGADYNNNYDNYYEIKKLWIISGARRGLLDSVHSDNETHINLMQ